MKLTDDDVIVLSSLTAIPSCYQKSSKQSLTLSAVVLPLTRWFFAII